MTVRVLHGDCRTVLPTLPAESVNCIVTSPPYFGLRSYLPAEHPDKRLEMGTEQTPDAYVAELVAVFRECRRVLREDGCAWLNLGDSYGSAGGDIFTGFNARWSGTGLDGGKQAAIAESAKGAAGKRDTGVRSKNLLGIPWRVAFALQTDGWYLRSDTVWAKPNPMPESVTDRPTKAHEYVFLLTRSARYWYDADAIREPLGEWSQNAIKAGDKWRRKSLAKDASRDRGDQGIRAGVNYAEKINPAGSNARSVWTIATQPFRGAHYATMPPALAERCIKAGCPAGGTVLDPFGGAGTTGMVADRLGRNAILIELNPDNVAMAADRVRADSPLLAEVSL
jgi:DNA modification methylase